MKFPPPFHSAPKSDALTQLTRYAMALFCAFTAVLAWIAMAQPLRDSSPYPVMLPFIAFAAWFGGLGPGLLTTALTTLWALSRAPGEWFLLPQELELALFFPIGIFIAGACGARHRARNEAKIVGAQLENSQKRYQTIVETASEGIWTTDADLHTTFVNARMAQMLGTSPEAMLGRPVDDWLFEGEDSPRRNVAANAHRASYQSEGRYRRADGRELWCLVNVSLLRDERGELSSVLALHTDITQRRQQSEAIKTQSEALKRSNERFELATRAVSGFISEWNLRDGVLWRSAGFREILGHDLAQIPDSLEWWHAQIHAEDLGRIEAELQDALARGDQVSREYRVRHADGSLIWLCEHSLAVRDDDGAPHCIVASLSDISARHAAEDALRLSEANFRQLADSMPQIVWSSRVDGAPEYLNRRWYEYSGQPQGEIRAGSWEAFCDPADWPHVRHSWHQSLSSGQPCRFEARLRDKNGVARWFLCRIEPVRDAQNGAITRWFGTATDIDDARRVLEAQRFLAAAGTIFSPSLDYEETLEQVAQLAVPTLGDWCFVVLKNSQGAPEMKVAVHRDPREVERFWQRHRPFGLDPNAPRGFAAVMRSGQPELVEEMKPAVWREVIPSTEYQKVVDEAGHRSTLIVPLETNGKILGCLGLSFAESERRFSASDVPLAQEIARRAAIAIENARLYRELQDADRRKDEFLAMLAHELRNPLAAISGARTLLDLLLEGEAKTDTATPRAILERQTAQLSRLVDDLLDVSRITRGKIELRRGRCDFIEIVKIALDGVRPLISSRRHDLRLDLASEPIPVFADPARLGQIVSNLVTNAAKYTDAGGQITVSLHAQNGEATFRVRDNGTGIAPEVLPSLWRLFVQNDRTLDRAQGGLGIGLTLVKSLTEMHGGRVSAASDGPGKGSEFEVSLPLMNAESGEESNFAAPIVAALASAATSTESTSAESVFAESTSTESTSAAPISTESTSTESTSVPPTSTPAISTAPILAAPISTEATSTAPNLVAPVAAEPLSGPPNSSEPPASDATRAPTPIASPVAELDSPPRLRFGAKNRVLVVDDNRDAAWMLSKWLEKQGYDVQLAFDGAQGLVLACGWQPDVALLDIGMPEMDGYEVARQLRSLPEGRAIRLIALTGYGQESDRARALEAGFDAHLTKPVSMEELQGVLEMQASLD